MLRILFSVLFFSLILSEDQTQELPIGFTPEEWQNRDIINQWGNRTDPPPGPVRNIAEYDPMQGVLIRYPFGISTSVIREMAEDIIVYCLVSSSQQNSAYNSMNNADVDMNNVEFILGSTDSYWTRDYGPWWVVDGNGDYAIVDFTYNRPRPNDNRIKHRYHQLPTKGHNLLSNMNQ
jgi:agmatine/peptidylarginine deiminase